MRKTRGHKKSIKSKTRKAPIGSATSLPEGTIKGSWVIKKASNGVPRWMKDVSVELNGFRRLTVDCISDKPIMLYVREYGSMWPKRNAWTNPTDETYFTAKFIPIKKGSNDGPVYMCHNGVCEDKIGDGMQVDSKLMSLNFMNQEMFVRV
jgi:hypothetical protein